MVTVEESQSFGIESEVVKGMQFDKGYVSPYMITNADRMEAEYKDPLNPHYRQKYLLRS